MPRKRVISIRFCAESKEDMELYARLEQEAGTSASLASVVKARLKASYARQELIEFQEKIVEAVREEIQESGMKVIETLLSNSDGGMWYSRYSKVRYQRRVKNYRLVHWIF